MKKTLVVSFLLMLSANGFSKIVVSDDKLYIQAGGKQAPLGLVNGLIEDRKITGLKLFNQGDVHLVSFARKGGPEKLYSVDDKGFVYSIEPFASYSVRKVNTNGTVEFNQVPGKKYKVNHEGIFIQ